MYGINTDRSINHTNGLQAYTDVGYRFIHADGSCTESKSGLVLETGTHGETYMMMLKDQDGKGVVQATISKVTDGFRIGKLCFTLNIEPLPIVLIFSSTQDVERFETFYRIASKKASKKNIFDERTDDASSTQYFQFYGYLSQQQNMMQDYIRTSTYQRAVLQNITDFRDKVVLDVGAGTGILSFFAVQAGARKVYAVEASNMAHHAETVVQSNNLSGTIKVIYGKIEEIELPEQVDMIISEPMGYMLFNERMLETYVHAKKFLRPGGKMFPSKGDLHVAPFTDDALYMEHFAKSNFWCQSSLYGVDFTGLRQAAIQEYYRQPIVDTFDVRILMAKPCTHTVNFLTCEEKDLHVIHIPLHYTVLMTGTLHGLAFWFDCAFLGSTNHVWLSTAPQEPLTHWYQVRCLLLNPIFVRAGQKVSGSVTLHANTRQSYDVEIEVSIDGTGVRSSNVLDLKNPCFRYTGVQTQPPPGSHNGSPTDAYWGNASVVLNGGLLSSSSSGVGGQQYSGGTIGGGLFAYSSQAVGNVMATGTVGHSGVPGQSVIAGVPHGNINSSMMPNAVDTSVVSQALRNVTIGNYQS